MKFVQSPYYSSRGNWKITGVVIHTCVGTYQGTIGYFQNNDRKVSAHYVVKEDGSEVTQMVDESQAAHHAGIISNPKTAVYRGGNPNFYTIGIENADNAKPHDHDRSGQYPTLAKLVREICQRHGIPIDKDHICGHRELYDKKTCPGNIDVDKVIQLAANETSPVPSYLVGIFAGLGVDLTTPEPQVRAQLQPIIDSFNNYKNLERRVADLEKQLIGKAGEVGNLEEALEKTTQAKNRLEETVREKDSALGHKDTEINSLRNKLKDYEGKVVITQDEYDRLNAAKVIDRFTKLELLKALLGLRG